MAGKLRYFSVALCVLSLACGGKKAEAPDRGGRAAVGKQGPVKDATIAKFRLGSASAPDGTVIIETRNFGRGESVFTSFEVPNAPARSRMRVAWFRLPDKTLVSSQEAPLVPENPAVAFKADSKGWPIGEYELEMSLAEAGKEVWTFMGTAQFKIVREKLN